MNLEDLEIQAEYNTPYIFLSKNQNKFILEGRSYPEDAVKFYTPIIKWFQEYLKLPNKETVIEIKLEYINTATYKVIVKMLSMIKENLDEDNKIKVKWYYSEDDEDIIELGNEIEKLIKIPFEYVKLEN